MAYKNKNQFLGLIKFYRKESEEYLDKLIEGCIHCQTPETYRMSDMEGVSDKFENCLLSYRPHRGDPPIKVTISNKDICIEDITSLTIRNSDQKDAWLQCWMTLRLPDNVEELEELKKDIVTMAKHFGSYFAFIPGEHLSEFIERVKLSTDKKIKCGEVTYSEDGSTWGNFCKSIAYSYQREYRLTFGECGDRELEAYFFNVKGSLSDIIYKKPEVKLESETDGTVWLDILELTGAKK